MSVEKIIKGKIDSCRHAGRISEVRRKAEAQARIDEYYRGEQDHPNMDFASFDPYTDGLVTTIFEAKKGA